MDLALAIAADCLAACTAALPPGHVFVVSSDRQVRALAGKYGAVLVADPGAGLNAAVTAGVAAAGTAGATRGAAAAPAGLAAVAGLGEPTPVAVLLADLPSVRPDDVVQALTAAAAHDRAVVPDASGEGTVVLSAKDGRRLVPRFGPGSAARHAAYGHVRLELDLPRLRTDVDDDVALAAAIRLGVGAATRAVLQSGPATLAAMQGTVHRFDSTTGAGSVLLDDGREVPFSAEVFATSALRGVRPGQRLSITTTAGDDSVSALWIVGIGDDQVIA